MFFVTKVEDSVYVEPVVCLALVYTDMCTSTSTGTSTGTSIDFTRLSRLTKELFWNNYSFHY
jgi:hypothetical protein